MLSSERTLCLGIEYPEHLRHAFHDTIWAYEAEMVPPPPCPRGPLSKGHPLVGPPFFEPSLFFVPKAAKMFWVPMTHYYLCHPTSCGNLHNSVAAYHT